MNLISFIEPLAALFLFVLFLKSLAAFAQMRGRSDRWFLIGLIPPLAGIALLVLELLPTKESTEYQGIKILGLLVFIGFLLGVIVLTVLPARPTKGVQAILWGWKVPNSPRIWAALMLSPAALSVFLLVHAMQRNFQEFYAEEAKETFFGLPRAMHEYKAKHGTYEVSDIKQLDLPPGYFNSRRYTYWYAVNGIPAKFPTTSDVKVLPGPCDVTTPPTSVKVEASATGFTAAAKGNLDDDPTCDEWSINDAMVLTNTINDVVK